MIGKLLFGAAVIAAVWFLLVPARWSPRRSPEGAIIAEIDQLQVSMQAYKEKHSNYPPCMAITDTNSRKSKFMQHLRNVYPGSTYGVQMNDFTTLNTYVTTNYRVQVGNATVGLDLVKLDQAEALVFWLAGFPTPVNTDTSGGGSRPIAPSRLFGFNTDSDSPMRRAYAQESSDPAATRTTSRFDFRQERLVDNDEDGWWEYVPTPPGTGSVAAPFVYFDCDSYGAASTSVEFLGYPRPGDAQADALKQAFGFAVPLAAYLDPKGEAPMRWQNPQSFQIICGGLDGQFSDPESGTRVPIFPSGFTYSGVGPIFNSSPGNYSELELDNLTNLSRLKLVDARAEAP
jgi:hypothetical protein